jgi:hypothetical protein
MKIDAVKAILYLSASMKFYVFYILCLICVKFRTDIHKNLVSVGFMNVDAILYLMYLTEFLSRLSTCIVHLGCNLVSEVCA